MKRIIHLSYIVIGLLFFSCESALFDAKNESKDPMKNFDYCGHNAMKNMPISI